TSRTATRHALSNFCAVEEPVIVIVKRIKPLLQSWRQFVFAPLAVIVFVEFAESLEHCGRKPASAADAASRRRDSNFVATEPTVAVFVQIFERGRRVFDFCTRKLTVAISVERTE